MFRLFCSLGACALATVLLGCSPGPSSNSASATPNASATATESSLEGHWMREDPKQSVEFFPGGYLAISAGANNIGAGNYTVAGQQLEVSWKAPSDRKIGYRMAGDELFLTMEDAKEEKFKRQGGETTLTSPIVGQWKGEGPDKKLWAVIYTSRGRMLVKNEEQSSAATGDYRTEGDKLLIKQDGKTGETSSTFSLEGNKLTLIDGEGKKSTLTRL